MNLSTKLLKAFSKTNPDAFSIISYEKDLNELWDFTDVELVEEWE